MALEPYRAKRAIIVGAGMGTRMMPATADRPKPMVFVNGTRIIDTLIDALAAVGIKDIIVVGGYRFEVMEKELPEKYPFLRLLENKKYSAENNISSALLAKEYFRGGCYFCEADVLVRNPEIIRKYHYNTDILGSWSLETDDWCFTSDNGMLADYKKGGTHCYNYYGISYWSDKDSAELRKDWEELYETPDGKELFWEFPAFMIRKEKYKVEIRPCEKTDVMEIDNFSELVLLDNSYSGINQ
ncbi:MAG: NTP transferase domain-containing protein [Lachnospiraceae bacterium]|nr:NTP transferase domain-containing protein [Lachnospiraceae bacterium]